MIWIHEQLTKTDKTKVAKLEPFVGFSFEPKFGVLLQTESSEGHGKHGKSAEDGKARFFGFKEITQGFICDDIDQALLLSKLIRKLPFSGKGLQGMDSLGEILEYLRIADQVLVEWIAIPVRTYAAYYSKKQSKHWIAVLDKASLTKWKIKLSDYVKHK